MKSSELDRKARRSFAVPVGLVVVAAALVVAIGVRDRMDHAGPANASALTSEDSPAWDPGDIPNWVERYRSPSRESGQTTQQDKPPAVMRALRGEELASAIAMLKKNGAREPEVLHFEMPPPGTDLILSVPQLRWCLREDRLLEIYRPNVVTEWDQDAFSQLVDRYGDRCESFRYQEGDLERARREVGGR